MLNAVRPVKFRHDFNRIQKSGKDMSKLVDLMDILLEEKPLPKRYKDHPLKGELKGCRGVHVEPDWVLIYAVKGSDMIFYRTGSHAELFGK
jgi:mRNA interferase YafQ